MDRGGETRVSFRARLRRPVPAVEVVLAPRAASHCCWSKFALGFDGAEQLAGPFGRFRARLRRSRAELLKNFVVKKRPAVEVGLAPCAASHCCWPQVALRSASSASGLAARGQRTRGKKLIRDRGVSITS